MFLVFLIAALVLKRREFVFFGFHQLNSNKLLFTVVCLVFIINRSDSPIDVEYKIKIYPNNPVLYDVPAKIPISQLENKSTPGYQMEKLSNNQYQFDKETGIVKVQVLPNEALWISSFSGCDGYKYKHLEYFSIQEISIKGIEGEIKYTKRQTLGAFSKVSDTLYTLTYR